MKFKIIFIGVFLTIQSLSNISAQEANPRMDEIRERIESHKIAFITHQTNLTPEEGQKFWPVYNQYQEEESKLRRDKIPPRKLEEMSEEEAGNYLKKMINLGERELALKTEYVARFQDILSNKKVVLLFQAERKFKEKLLQQMNSSKKWEKEKRNKRNR